MAYVPRTKILTDKLINDETIEIDGNVSIGSIALPSATEEAIGEATICSEEDFNDGDPEVYETFTYTGRDVENQQLTGVSHKDGTIKDWDAGSVIFSKTPATPWDELRAKAADHNHDERYPRAQEGAKNIWVSSTPPTALSVGDIWIEID